MELDNPLPGLQVVLDIVARRAAPVTLVVVELVTVGRANSAGQPLDHARLAVVDPVGTEHVVGDQHRASVFVGIAHKSDPRHELQCRQHAQQVVVQAAGSLVKRCGLHYALLELGYG